jgi:hypothetical protein
MRIHPGQTELRLYQANAAYNLICHLGARDPATELYDGLRALAVASPNEAELQEIFQRAQKF